ncbi:hypothetical protein HYC85_017398, partial [Camellia sinensis]
HDIVCTVHLRLVQPDDPHRECLVRHPHTPPAVAKGHRLAASELIRSSAEPILEQYRSVILSSLKFSKLTLGAVAAQFTGIDRKLLIFLGVPIIEGDAMGITMELKMQWDGNRHWITYIGQNIGFTGVFKLIFKPLVDEFPYFGAVCYSLMEKKNMDFTLKVVGGELSAILGISDAIEDMIQNAIEDSITWPIRKIIPILPGDYSLYNSQKIAKGKEKGRGINSLFGAWQGGAPARSYRDLRQQLWELFSVVEDAAAKAK